MFYTSGTTDSNPVRLSATLHEPPPWWAESLILFHFLNKMLTAPQWELGVLASVEYITLRVRSRSRSRSTNRGRGRGRGRSSRRSRVVVVSSS